MHPAVELGEQYRTADGPLRATGDAVSCHR